jgi:rhodanese-related sulfurtransferase
MLRSESAQNLKTNGIFLKYIRGRRTQPRSSKNIPLQEIGSRVSEVKAWKKPLVVCCRSGNRSGQAMGVLQQAGVECINGGSWTSVNATQAAE